MKELKDKNSSHVDMKENLRFQQSQLNYISNQKSIRLVVIGSIGIGMVSKTNNEIYVLNTIKTYRFFSFVFYFEKRCQHAKIVVKKRINGI